MVATDSNTCTGTGATYKSIPGHPRWGLAPIEMAWQGKSLGQICQQMKDPARNGGRTLALLQGWLASDEEPLYELRDEGMLKLFFSDSLPERRIENIRAMRTRQERKLAQLRAIEPHAKEGPPGAYLTLQLGIGSTEWFIEWCAATERRLAAETEQE